MAIERGAGRPNCSWAWCRTSRRPRRSSRRPGSPSTRPSGTSTCRRSARSGRRTGRRASWPGRSTARATSRPGSRLFNAAFADHATPLQLDAGVHRGRASPTPTRRRRRDPASRRRRPASWSASARPSRTARRPRRLDHGEIWTVGVRPDRQGRGLGRQLLRWGVERLRDARRPERQPLGQRPERGRARAVRDRRASSGAGRGTAGRDPWRDGRAGPSDRWAPPPTCPGRSPRSPPGRGSRRCSARSASRSRGSSTAGPRSRPRPGRSSAACSGCRSSASSRGSSSGATAALPRADRPAGADRRRSSSPATCCSGTTRSSTSAPGSRRSSATSRSSSSALVAWVVFGERPPRSVLLALPFVLVGVVLISGASAAGRTARTRRSAWCSASCTALCYAGYLLVIRRGGRDLRRPAGPVAIATVSTAVVAALVGHRRSATST